MRDIKFRAWSKDNNEMIFDSNMHGNKLGVCLMLPLNGVAQDVAMEKFEDCNIPIMQYTGEKDKNGVEIYEGDIMRWGESFILEVIYEKNHFAMSGKDIGFLEFPYFEESEVIGNIYESPHLLDNN